MSAGLLGRAFRSPGVLLVVVGVLLGMNFPLGKLALAAGVSPVVWASVIAVGSTVCLGGLVILQRRPVSLRPRDLRYFVITAVISFVVPNLLMFVLIPRLGSGLTGLLLTLSPMLTVVLAVLARQKASRPLELLGVAIGFAGAVIVASARGEVGRPAEWIWLAVGALVPLSLALGNVYRTMDWPPGADPLWLGAGANAAAALMLITGSLVVADHAAVAALATIPLVVVAQVICSGGMFALFFRLQAVGGPVTLSQIGTVAAAVGIFIGTIGLGERYPDVVWLGVLVIALGIGITIRARWGE